MDFLRSAPASAWLAGALSLFLPGVGHAYAGWYRSGALVLLGYGAALLAWNFASLYGTPFLLGGSVLALAACVFSARDAWILTQVAEAADQPARGKRVRVVASLAAFAAYWAVAVGVSLLSPVKTYEVGSAAMAPNLLMGDAVLADRRAYRLRAPERGDIVVFRSAREPSRAQFSRVVGLPGDRIAVRHGRVVLNGTPIRQSVDDARAEQDTGRALLAWLESRRLPDVRFLNEEIAGIAYSIVRIAAARVDALATDAPEVSVGPDEFFVLGDNRDFASDSRVLGLVHRSEIEAQVRYAYRSGSRWRNRSLIR